MTPKEFVDLEEAIRAAMDSLPPHLRPQLQGVIDELDKWAKAQGPAFVDGVIAEIERRKAEAEKAAQEAAEKMKKIIEKLEKLKKDLEALPDRREP